jgi:ubiquinone biosynthesis accessory factor UbiJ
MAMIVTSALVNRTLDDEPWALERLAAHAGRTFRVAIGPMHFVHAIDDSGRLREATQAPDLTLSVSPLRVPALLAQPSRWNELVAVEGDAALAATLAELALTLPMFVEQAFTQALGPVVGTQVAATGARLLAIPDHAAGRFGESVARYLGEESEAVVRGSEARAFAENVNALAVAVDALAARVDALAHRPARKR